MPYESFQILIRFQKFQVTEGRLPEKEDELALADFWKDRYQIGQVIHLSQKKGSNSQLKRDSYTITGFVHSPDIFSKQIWGVQPVVMGI